MFPPPELMKDSAKINMALLEKQGYRTMGVQEGRAREAVILGSRQLVSTARQVKGATLL